MIRPNDSRYSLRAPTNIASGLRRPVEPVRLRLRRVPRDDPMKEQHSDLTEGSIFRSVWVLAVPMVVGSVLQNFSSVADIFFVGKLGAEAVAAVSIGGIVLDVLWTFISGTSMGFRALISRAIGARQYADASHVAHQGIFLTLFVSLPLVAVGGLYAGPITVLLGAEPSVVPLATVYFRIIILSASLYLLTHAISAVLHGAGEAKIPARAMLLVTFLTVTLEPILVFGWGPVPALGVRGAALSLVLCYVCASAYLLRVLFRGCRGVRLSLHGLRVDPIMLWKILRIGIPRSFQRSFRAFTAIAMIRIVAGFGTHTLAAYGIAMRILVVVLSPGWGLASVAATLVGQNLGAGQPKRAERSAWTACMLYGAVVLCFAAVFLLFGDRVIGIFNGDPEVVRRGARLLHLTSPFYLFLAAAMVLGSALGGSGDTVSPMVITAVSLAGVQIGAALFLPYVFNLQEDGLWLAISCGLVVWGGTMAGWFHVGRWKEKVL